MPTRFSPELLARARCSLEERQALLPLVGFLLHCHQRARREGIPVLETEEVEDPFLRTLFHRLIDGVSAEALEGPLLNLLHVSSHTGQALLRRVLIVEGALSIAEGTGSNLLRRGAFHGLLGEAFFGRDLVLAVEQSKAAEISEAAEVPEATALAESGAADIISGDPLQASKDEPDADVSESNLADQTTEFDGKNPFDFGWLDGVDSEDADD